MADNLFENSLEERFDEFAPLAARLRPKTLDDFVGQSHLVGEGAPLRVLIESDKITSMILFGPAGTGKTSLATIMATKTGSRIQRLSAVNATVADLRKVIGGAKDLMGANGIRTLLFIDEIHRFNKAQQDALLPGVEDGIVVLVGATTENPFFEINSPLISRSLLFRLERLESDDVRKILERALVDTKRGLGGSGVEFTEGVVNEISSRSGGDARWALNALEMCAAAAQAGSHSKVDEKLAAGILEEGIMRYDKGGDTHYDVVSAFIKSLRGSDPNAAIWWLATMLEGGEDPRFIARRMVIFASEDVGNADPAALGIAISAFQALEFVGLPEARLNLAQAATYLACAEKSNSSYVAINEAMRDVKAAPAAEVPMHLRDASYGAAKTLGHGKGYKYPHDHPEAWVKQSYLPPGVAPKAYYRPSGRGGEAEILKRQQARQHEGQEPSHRSRDREE